MGFQTEKSTVIQGPFPKAVRLDSPLLCSWDNFKHLYPYETVISPSELRLIKGLASNRKACATIIGETGTGKEEVAKLIHKLRCESEGKLPFVAVNCATITKSLAESLLFGHRKGAFTGAEASTNGYIHEANGGILFLDEIQTLSIPIQQKLLRVLNDGTYNRLGETAQMQSHFQLVTASTKDLDEEVDRGGFLLDLRNRMTGIDLHLMPLRQRKEDIPALVALHLTKKGISISNRLFQELTGHLETFHWRGNIRQLFKALDTWVLLSEIEKVPLSIERIPVFKGMLDSKDTKSMAISKEDFDLLQAIRSDCNMHDLVARIEAKIIKEAISRHKNVGDAARAMGVSRSGFDAKRRKYGLLDT